MYSKQVDVLNKYAQAKGKQTLREISQDTGINTSRLFRLMNGYEMKISEYQIFERKLEEYEFGEHQRVLELMKHCLSSLESPTIEEIEKILHTKVKLKKLVG